MRNDTEINRRQALIIGGAAAASTLGAVSLLPTSLSAADSETGLVRSIKRQTLWSNMDGKSVTWFHPRACMFPNADGTSSSLMTLQSIAGSDYFGPVHWTRSDDLGKTWSKPEQIHSLGRKPVPGHEGLKAGVCDVVPQYHAPTKTVLAMGHVVYYRGAKFSKKDQLSRYPVYAVRREDGSWSDSHILEWDDPRGAAIYSNNCGQRVVLPNGDIQMSFTFGATTQNRAVAGVRCRFDGERLQVIEVGPALELNHKRGLIEPSVTTFQDRFYITIRAEDDHGYVAASNDGLNWEAKKQWSWDDGTPLTMSTTQQHWLTHSDGLFLVYTRKDKSNTNVIRWRAPLYMAQVDPTNLTLIRSTERVVHPLVGDGVNKPKQVPLMGNFNVTNASPQESWVTVGSWKPYNGARGETLLARITWNKPNRLV